MSNLIPLKTVKDLIINFKDINLFDLNDEELKELNSNIVNNVRIKELKSACERTVLKLSAITKPRFGADLEFIWRDNQKRLELINTLFKNMLDFEVDVKNYKRNKYGCRENTEHILTTMKNLQELLDTIQKYLDFQRDNLDYEYKALYSKDRDIKYLKE